MARVMLTMIALALLLGLAPAQASEGPRLHATVPRTDRTYVDLRVGVLAAPGLAPEAMGQICGTVTPIRRLGIEACGNGSGVLHNRGGADFAHFRLKATALEQRRGQTTWALNMGVGFAEVQRAADAPGFRFGPADDGQVEAAGPEVAVGVSSRGRASGSGHWIVDLTAGVAHIDGAPVVMGVSGPVVPFVGLTMGAGF